MYFAMSGSTLEASLPNEASKLLFEKLKPDYLSNMDCSVSKRVVGLYKLENRYQRVCCIAPKAYSAVVLATGESLKHHKVDLASIYSL
jgi:hypothetical protein